MKKIILLFIFVFSLTNICIGQEWFTSFEVARKMATAQNKMLFVVWEDSFKTPYYVSGIKDEKGKSIFVDLTQNEEINAVVWQYFIPLIMPESEYANLYNKAKEINSDAYLARLEDAGIKIMDVNGYILNTNIPVDVYEDFPSLVEKYALNTAYLNSFLTNYRKKTNFTTTLILASKYLDYAALSKKDIRKELAQLSNSYLKEARSRLVEVDAERKEIFEQKIDLYDVMEYLILNNPKKAKRQLKKIEEPKIYTLNESLFVFLNYTTFILLQDEENAVLWRERVSQTDLRKVSLILKSTY